MPRYQRIYLLACALVIGFIGAYCLSEWAALPKLYYFPLAREWQLWSHPPSPVPMGYIGLILWGLGGALVCGALTWLLSARLRQLSDGALRMIGAWALSAFILGGCFFTWNLFPF